MWCGLHYPATKAGNISHDIAILYCVVKYHMRQLCLYTSAYIALRCSTAADLNLKSHFHPTIILCKHGGIEHCVTLDDRIKAQLKKSIVYNTAAQCKHYCRKEYTATLYSLYCFTTTGRLFSVLSCYTKYSKVVNCSATIFV